jgi:hypothetical protein
MVKGKKKQQKKSDDSYDAWVEFSKKMGDRINELAKDQVSEYKELYKLWSEYAQKMTEHMSAFSPDDSKAFEGMQQIWAQYSGKLGEMLMDSSGKDNGPYKELYDLWDQYSNSMSEHASELMKENLKNQQELYELWMDAFGIKDEGQKEHDNGPYNAINSFFKRMWEHSVSSIQPTASPDENFRKLSEEWQDLWMKAYSKSVMDIVRSPAFADFNGHTLDTNLEMKQTSDRFANWYLSTMGVPTQQNVDEIHQKLHDLDRKMSDITRILNELSSTIKK